MPQQSDIYQRGTQGLARHSDGADATVRRSHPVHPPTTHTYIHKQARLTLNRTAKFRIPEAVRQADLRSREYLRKNYHP